ncbi:MAG: riboflavin synthase [Bacteroidota bacterium]
MFTGIVEDMGTVVKMVKEKSNFHFTIQARIGKELKIDQSVCHNGVCLTTVKVDKKKSQYVVTAIKETLEKSSLGILKPGSKVNLERSMRMDGFVDGHIVQGHVDQTAECVSVKETDGSWLYKFKYDPKKGHYTVSKGSISVDGVSLTVVDSEPNYFSVAIIPFTYDNTIFHQYKKGSVVNIEFDVIGKYVARLLELHLGKEKKSKKKKK